MSTIKVDTYLTRGGASEIAIDKLKGASSASSISVVAEGGTNTTNLQQGLTKCWYLDSEGGSSLDSFNVSSNTDNDTGDYTKGFTNNFSSDNFSPPASCGQNTSFFVINKARATSSVTQFNILHNNTSIDGRQVCVVCGDLA